MKALSISYSGMEDVTALEIKELIGKESDVHESCVSFDASMEELAKYCYKSQGVNRVLLLLDSFKIKKVEELERISKIDFSSWLDNRTFAARSSIIESDLDHAEVEKTTGDYIEGKVDLKNPDVTVFIYVYQNNCYVGIDFSGEISKRDYKISLCRDDLKGTVAYALVRLSGYSTEKSFLNLNAKSGTIAIEAALFGSGKSAHYYDKKKFPFLKFFDYNFEDSDLKEIKVYAHDSDSYLNSTRKNTKVAGVNVKLEKIDADSIVKYERGKAEVSGLKIERLSVGKKFLK